MEGKEHGAVNVQWTLSLRGSHKVLQLAIVMEPHRDRKVIRQVIPRTRQGIVRLKGSSNVSEMSNVLMNHSALIINCEKKKKNSVRSTVRPPGKAMDHPEKVIDRAVE